MPKKKNNIIPDIPDFNQIPLPISKQKPGDYLSVGRTRKIQSLPGDACDFSPSADMVNLDIIKQQGRSQGALITYSANQIYNYQSQSQRYDASIDLIPAYVTDNGDGTITYGFCSHGSQKGFWEVVVGTNNEATFINLSPQFLTILCPRPFQLNELVTVNTDSTVFNWSQIAGSRTVLISLPTDKYPLIDIQGSCYTDFCDSGTQSPIILRVETDNNLIFTDLVIFNRPTDFYYGLGYAAIYTDSTNNIVFYRVPGNVSRAFIWAGEDILVTWTIPSLDADFIARYRLQKLFPPYTDVLAFLPTDIRIATIQANYRYRMAVDYSINTAIKTSYSNILFFNYPVTNHRTIYADDIGASLGYLSISDLYTKLELGGQFRNLIEDTGMLGYLSVSDSYDKLALGGQILTLSDDADTGLGYVRISESYVKIDLGGVIIG